MAIREATPVVLLVEDDAPVRSFIRIALEDTASLIEAPDGEQALHTLERLGESTPDLLLLDYVIPNRSGLEILTVVRAQWPSIPVVIITGFGSEDVAIQALRAGARDYLRKPIDVDQLRQTVAALTAQRASGGRAGTDPMAGNHFPRARHRGIARALEYAREHCTEFMTLPQVAREASMSKFHFCRVFHREMGVSFKQYLQELRVRRAQALLADPNLSVTEVAYAAGFNDLSTFDKVFRKIAGVAPRAYRRGPLPS